MLSQNTQTAHHFPTLLAVKWEILREHHGILKYLIRLTPFFLRLETLITKAKKNIYNSYTIIDLSDPMYGE